jgi:hypothetical protein
VEELSGRKGSSAHHRAFCRKAGGWRIAGRRKMRQECFGGQK